MKKLLSNCVALYIVLNLRIFNCTYIFQQYTVDEYLKTSVVVSFQHLLTYSKDGICQVYNQIYPDIWKVPHVSVYPEYVRDIQPFRSAKHTSNVCTLIFTPAIRAKLDVFHYLLLQPTTVQITIFTEFDFYKLGWHHEEYLLMTTKKQLLLVSSRASPTYLNFPAVKIDVAVPRNSLQIPPTIVVCNNYCTTDWDSNTPVNWEFLQSFLKPLQFHKDHYRIATKKVKINLKVFIESFNEKNIYFKIRFYTLVSLQKRFLWGAKKHSLL